MLKTVYSFLTKKKKPAIIPDLHILTLARGLGGESGYIDIQIRSGISQDFSTALARSHAPCLNTDSVFFVIHNIFVLDKLFIKKKKLLMKNGPALQRSACSAAGIFTR